jgi:colicin import membrane protein
MAEQKESSVLFSLKELMNLEEDRIRQEEAERQRAANAEMQARAEAERRAREQEEARIRAEEDRRRAEEQRGREEAARLEAIRHGEVERARVEAEQAARLEAMRHHQEHERQITAIKEGKGKKQAIIAAVAAGVILVAGGITAGLIIHNQNKAAEIERARAQAELAEQKAQTERLQRELTDQNNAVASLEDAVKNARDEGAKEAAMKALKDAQDKQAAARSALNRARTGGPAAAKPANKPACNCAPGDPLCSCIQ